MVLSQVIQGQMQQSLSEMVQMQDSLSITTQQQKKVSSQELQVVLLQIQVMQLS
jgi:hypothetical protein